MGFAHGHYYDVRIANCAVYITLCCLIGHISWMVTYTCLCTDNNTRTAPLGGIAVMPYRWSCLPTKPKRQLIIPILKIFLDFIQSFNPPNTLPYYGGTMVQLHHVLSVAYFPHKPPAGTLKQYWPAFYRSILRMVTASYESVWDNRTMLTIPGQFCCTICIIPPVRNTVLSSITAV